jgi:hypothetical protein
MVGPMFEGGKLMRQMPPEFFEGVERALTRSRD